MQEIGGLSDSLVERILSADPDPEIFHGLLKELPKPHHPKIDAIISMQDASLRAENIDYAMAAAEAACVEESDVNLHTLFLLCWYRFLLYCGIGPPMTRVIADQISAFTSEESPPEFRAWAQYLLAVTKFHEGDTISFEQSIDTLPSMVDSHSKHHRRLVAFRILELLRLGKGAQIEESPLTSEHVWEGIFAKRYTINQFINCAMTGDLSRTDALRSQINGYPTSVLAFAQIDLEVAAALVDMMRLVVKEKNKPDFTTIPTDDGDITKAWIQSTQALLHLDIEQSLYWARLYMDQGLPKRRTIIGFDEYSLVRAELATGNWEAARRLLLARAKRGTYHFIDDFFYAQIECKSDNLDVAAQHFHKLHTSITNYKAEGRLNFEARLAPNLTLTDTIELSHRMQHFSDHPSIDILPTHHGAQPITRGTKRILSASTAMAEVKDLINTFAAHHAPVLITGETGTGKELVAQALHEESSRHREPFIPINCGSISDSLMESELFGHTRGAFTGANRSYPGLFREAGAGTLFLDEIGEISSRLQVALLRVLEAGKVRPVGSSESFDIHCRVITATNADLQSLAERGSFRSDLIFRLQRLQIHLPALRERRDDIEPLIDHFLNQGRGNKGHARISPLLRTHLREQNWPGNIRELRNVIERLRLLSSDKLWYDIDDLRIISLHSRKSKSSPLTTSKDSAPAKSPSATSPSRLPVGTTDHDIEDYLSRKGSALRRLKRLRELFSRFHELKLHEIEDILGVSHVTARRYLKILCEEGYITKVTPSRSTRSHYYRFAAGEGHEPRGQ